LLYRVSVGDHAEAIDIAEVFFERRNVPIVLLPSDSLDELMLGYRAYLLLGCIDGETALQEVIDASGLDLLDALRALCELIEKSVVSLR
jgi:hypothetical protein